MPEPVGASVSMGRSAPLEAEAARDDEGMQAHRRFPPPDPATPASNYPLRGSPVPVLPPSSPSATARSGYAVPAPPAAVGAPGQRHPPNPANCNAATRAAP